MGRWEDNVLDEAEVERECALDVMRHGDECVSMACLRINDQKGISRNMIRACSVHDAPSLYPSLTLGVAGI